MTATILALELDFSVAAAWAPKVGDLVVNFGQPARVVGFWPSTGEVVLQGIGGGAAGTRWCADPAKCRPAI